MNDVEISPQDAREAYLRMVDGDPRPSREPLNAAHAHRATTREALESITQAVGRAEQLVTAHAADVQKMEATVAHAQTESANRLSAQLTSNDPLASIGVEPSREIASAQSELEAARSRAAVSARALESLRAAHAQAQAEARAAETAAEDAAIAIYVAQVEVIAREATEYRAKAEGARKRVNEAMSIAEHSGRIGRPEVRLWYALQTPTITTAGAPPAPSERRRYTGYGSTDALLDEQRWAAAVMKPWQEQFGALIRGDLAKSGDSKAA
jgi:hypothetical protein